LNNNNFNKINVCISCDDNYSKYAGVTMASILANAQEYDDIAFYILDGGIKDEHKEQILELKSIKNCAINFIKIDENLFNVYKNVKTHTYISIATYYRLKLASMLSDVEKILYLDCDVIVNTSLAPMFEIEMGKNVILGANDLNKKMVKKNPNYINAGVALMDLNKIREEKIEEKFEEYTKENAASITCGDQEIINEVLKERIKIIAPEWNVQSSNFINRSSYTNQPKIIHFVAAKKPWHYASFSIHKNLYFKYLQLTPWRLDEKELKHWVKDNQLASLIEYAKYRPLFALRPRFYIALYESYVKPLFNKNKKN